MRWPPYFLISLSSYSSAISATSRSVAVSSSGSSVVPPRIVCVNSTVCSPGSQRERAEPQVAVELEQLHARATPSTSTPFTSCAVQRTIALLSPHGTTLIIT